MKYIGLSEILLFVTSARVSASPPSHHGFVASLPTFSRSSRNLNNRPAPVELALSSASIASSSVPRINSDDIAELSRKGYVIIRDFLPPDLVSDLRRDVSSLRDKNKFKVARIGQDSTNALNTDIRVAETCFIGPSKLGDCPDVARDRLYNTLDALRDDLTGNPALDEKDVATGELMRAAPALDKSLFEMLYAYYPTGGFYRRHRDAIPGSASVLRSYSLLMYLNEDWKQDDGGELRLHMDSGGDFLPEGEAPNFLDVEPYGGTLVLFKSDKVPHEVLDTQAERAAIVGWYNRAATASDIGELASESDKVRAGMLLVAAALVTGGLISLLA